MNCATRGCQGVAVAAIPGYPDPLPECWQHAEEYVERYGVEGINPLDGTPLTLVREHAAGVHVIDRLGCPVCEAVRKEHTFG